jgi:hypothetical protein
MGGSAQSKLAFISSTLKEKSQELNKSKTLDQAVDKTKVNIFFH